MKKILLIIGMFLLLLIVGVWAYLFIYGAPQNPGEIFTRFGIGGSEEEMLPIQETTVDVGDGESGTEKLKQLTVKPVAGARFTDSGISYVEQGTGHLYHIDLATGEERLMSGTTIAQARDAVFSTDGTYVAIAAPRNGKLETRIALIDGLAGKINDIVRLPDGAGEVEFGNATSTFYYLLKNENGSVGYSYDMEKGVGTELFRIPLRDVHALWGETLYVYTTPTIAQRGYLYEVAGTELMHVHKGGSGLMALSGGDSLVVSTFDAPGFDSETLTASNTIPLSLPLISEKCTASENEFSVFYCGVPGNFSGENFPDGWYMGIRSYSDTLFKVDVETDEWTLLADLLGVSGREIDIADIGVDQEGEHIYFINKNDNTLWMFDTAL